MILRRKRRMETEDERDFFNPARETVQQAL